MMLKGMILGLKCKNIVCLANAKDVCLERF